MIDKENNPALWPVTVSEIHKDLQHEIRMEVEYLLSGIGLKQNPEIEKIVKSSPTGSVPIETIMNFERIKELKVPREELLMAIADSEKVEIDGDGIGIKKAENMMKDDDMEPAVSKKRKVNPEEGALKEDNPNLLEEKLYKITLSDKLDMKGKSLRELLEEALGVTVLYARLSGKEGYFAIELPLLNQMDMAKLAHAPIELNGVIAKIQECWDDDLDKFYKRHGKHLDAFLERSGRRRKVRTNKDEVDLVFYCKKYASPLPLDYLFEGILSKTKNGEIVNPADQRLLQELITYHDNYQELSKDLKFFTVGLNPNQEASRCFFAVKNDNTRIPFTFSECYDNLLTDYIDVRMSKEIDVEELKNK